MKFNYDVSGLDLGSEIPVVECEQLCGYKVTEAAYALKVMQLAQEIMAVLWKEGREYTVVCEQGAVKVLTHEEATIYNARRFHGTIDTMRRCHTRLLAVDTSSFDDELRERHTKSIVRTSRILGAVQSSRAELRMKAHESNLPKRKV